MARKSQRLGNNSTDRHVAAFADAGSVVAVPRGFEFSSEEETTLWATYTAARSRVDWLPHDLIMVAKLVQTEMDIREARRALKIEGMVVENNRGTMVENAWLRVYDTLARQQLAIIRSLSMNSTSSEKAIVQRSAKEDQKAVKTLEELGVEGLLAQPN
jgi:hypothetical protein